LETYDATYLQRKKEVGEKFFTCKSSRKLCYFTDGASNPNDEGISVVLCLHACGNNKWTWLEKEPFKDIFQISVDRMGHGRSSDTPAEGYYFDELIPELMELVDAVFSEYKIPKEKKFFVIGTSMGGTITVEMAACPEVRDRIAAIAPMSAPSDIWNPLVTKQERNKAMPFPPLRNIGKKGCCTCRWVAVAGLNFAADWMIRGTPKPGEDDKLASLYKEYLMGSDGGGDKRAKDAAYSDPFLVTKILDTMIPGPHTRATFRNEFIRANSPWAYDPSEITVPCFIYNGEKEETPVECARMHKKLIPGSELILWTYGHVSWFLENRRIIQALVNKKKVDEPPLYASDASLRSAATA